MTDKTIKGVATGAVVTSIIQSSLTTVMLVSMVNAGLMTLQQSAGVIFGANIETSACANSSDNSSVECCVIRHDWTFEVSRALGSGSPLV